MLGVALPFGLATPTFIIESCFFNLLSYIIETPTTKSLLILTTILLFFLIWDNISVWWGQ